MPETELPPLIDGEVIEKINKEDITPINDTNHDHIFEPDPKDDTDSYTAMMCVKLNCGLGYLQAKK